MWRPINKMLNWNSDCCVFIWKLFVIKVTIKEDLSLWFSLFISKCKRTGPLPCTSHIHTDMSILDFNNLTGLHRVLTSAPSSTSLTVNQSLSTNVSVEPQQCSRRWMGANLWELNSIAGAKSGITNAAMFRFLRLGSGTSGLWSQAFWSKEDFLVDVTWHVVTMNTFWPRHLDFP